MLSKLGVFATLALAASAVLLPPSVSAADFDDDKALGMMVISPFRRIVPLECPGCAFVVGQDNSLSWNQSAGGTGNTLYLDFEIGPNEDTLVIDGVQLYPPSMQPTLFYVTSADPTKQTKDVARLQVTGFEASFNAAETITEAGTDLLPVTFNILSIESHWVDLPALKVNLLKDVRGRLMIASTETVKPVNLSPIDQKDKDCKEWPLLCKWKSILADKIKGMKGSMGKGCGKHKGNPMQQHTTHGKPPHKFRPGHPQHRPHFEQGEHRHSAHHRMFKVIRYALLSVFVPILVGMLVGTLTYLLGMALGCVIAMVMAKIRGRPAYEIVLQQDEEAGGEPRGEKEEYAELPEHEAPPVYEEAAEKEVVDGTQ